MELGKLKRRKNLIALYLKSPGRYTAPLRLNSIVISVLENYTRRRPQYPQSEDQDVKKCSGPPCFEALGTEWYSHRQSLFSFWI